MRILVLIILLKSLLFGNEIIRITNGEWIPFMSKEVRNYGFVSEIVSEAFLLEGIKVEYGFYPWVRSLELARIGQWDGTIGWAKTEEREKDFYFSDEPIWTAIVVFFYLSSTEFDWKKMGDLKEYRIGVTSGYSYGKEFDSFAEENKDLIEYTAEDINNFKKLLAGRIDVFPMDIDVGLYIVNKYFRNDSKFIRTHLKILDKRPQYLLLSKRNPNNAIFIERFNRGLKKLKENGKEEKILKIYRELYKN